MAENGLLFIVSDKHGNRPNTIYLVNDNWDDWFTYSTGGIQLDSLFIDEGFGSLDDECIFR